MKRLKRDPLRHDAFGYLSEFARELEIPIHTAATLKHLGREIVQRVKQLAKNPAYVHGHRAEATFEMIVASLDAVRLLKQEDAGRFYHAPDLEIGVPDYRLVLKDGRQILVEVKNETEIQQHGHTKAYFEKMLAYAALMNCDLYFAIHWVRWRQWTLVHARHFKLAGARYELDLVDALRHNEMSLVGDQHFATTSLRVRVEFEPRAIEKLHRGRSLQKVIIKQVGLYCDGRRIEDPAELRIAMAFAFYGTWEESESTETNAEGGVTAHNFDFAPQMPDEEGPSPYERNGGFAMIASLSGIITGQYNARTTRGGKLTGVLPKFEPGSMKDFLPDDFFDRQDRALRLWAFTMAPAGDEQAEQAITDDTGLATGDTSAPLLDAHPT